MKYMNFFAVALLAASISFSNSAHSISGHESSNQLEGLRSEISNPSSDNGQQWRDLLFIQNEKPMLLSLSNGEKDFYQVDTSQDGWIVDEFDLVSKTILENGVQSHQVCSYPGRFNWVHQKLWGKPMPFPSHCPSLSNWIKDGKVESVDLLFVSGYLSNPASTFGHTLLNVRTGLGSEHRSLEDSMNYGALVPPGEGVIPYIFKGLFGGYSAGFSDGAYSAHMNTYQEKELRAIWRYEFNFSESQKMDFIYRVAEVVTFKFPYYFLSENCGWAMGRLIEDVSGARLNMNDDPTWFAPIELIHLLKGAINPVNGEPLVKKVYYTPAGQSVLQARFDALSPESRALYLQAVADPFAVSKSITSGFYQKVSDTEYALDAALSYWQTVNLDSESDKYINEKDAILKARLSLPAKKPYIPEIAPYPNSIPHDSQKSGQMQAGISVSETRNTELKLKFASFEQGDKTLHALGVGRELSVFVFEAAQGNGKTRLDEATILAVSSVGVPDDTGLSQYKGLLSWRVQMGLGRRLGEPDYQSDLFKGGLHGLRPKFTGALGFAKTNADRTAVLGAYLEPELGIGEHPIAFGWLTKAQYRPNHNFSTTLDLRLRSAYRPSSTDPMAHGQLRQASVFVESNSVIRVSKDNALIIELFHSDFEREAGISFSHTF